MTMPVSFWELASPPVRMTASISWVKQAIMVPIPLAIWSAWA